MNAAVRVLRITPHLFRPGIWPVGYDPVGGMQTQVWKLTEELDKAGVSQTVLTSHIPGYPRRTKPFGSTQIEAVGVALPEFAAGRLLNFTWGLAVISRLLTTKLSYDLIHIHYNHAVWCRVLTLFAKRLEIPVVVSLNTELWVENGPRLRSWMERFDLATWIERLAIGASDRVITLTNGAAALWARELQLERDRIIVIPDAVDADSFAVPIDKAELDGFRRRHSIPMDSSVVAYVSRIRSEKGWQDLPEIVEDLSKSGAFMLICGDGPDRRKLEAALHKVDRPDSWCITGFLGPEDIRIALRLANVLVLPSRREAFGSVLLEAMASGLPAVAYGVGGIVEVAGRPNAIVLVPPNDRSALRQAILAVLKDPQKRDDLIGR